MSYVCMGHHCEVRSSYPIVLASRSPRRIELLRRIVPEFEIEDADVEETPRSGETPRILAERLAKAKADAVFLRRPQSIVIAGDTVVAVGLDLLGKPFDQADARRMLRRLSGKTHQVVTGIAIRHPDGETVFSEVSRVIFRRLTAPEITNYVASGEPMDKAGAYAIQGGAAGFVVQVEGSWTNVVGLPIERLSRELEALGVDS